MSTIYLDHQATTPVSASAVRAMIRHMEEVIGNPHSADHSLGWRAAEVLEDARAAVARRLGAEPDELVFTSGATEANNLVILGAWSPDTPRSRLVISAIEHRSVIGPARELARRGMELVVVPCGPDGVVEADRFACEIDERTLVAALMLTNNETGAVQPVRAVADRCNEVGAHLHVDAAQAFRWLPIDVLALGCATLSVSAHKIGGPAGIGGLWIDPLRRPGLRPLLHGGEQEGGSRAGTVPGFLASGFAAAVAELLDDGGVANWRAATERLLRRLRSIEPGIVLNGPAEGRHPGSLNVRVPDVEASRLIALMQPEVAVSLGSACTSGLPEPSHVLTAMGLTAEEADRSFRISTAPSTGEEDFDGFARALMRALETARAAG